MAACDAYNSPIEYFLDWEFIRGTVCAFADQIGVSLTFLMIFGIVYLSLYKASGSVVVPTATFMLLAPLLVGLLPWIAIQVAWVIELLMLGIAGMVLWRNL